MNEKCLSCDLRFATHWKMKDHYTKTHLKNYDCPLCPKSFQISKEREHHLNLEHRGMSSFTLDCGSRAVETKKQLGEYINKDGEGGSLECCECFEMFSSIDRLNDHRKINHNMQLTDEAKAKLEKISKSSYQTAPNCEVCKKIFLAIIVCKINNKMVGVCLNCYENHYGPNALTHLTIGTPNEIIKKMKVPLV